MNLMYKLSTIIFILGLAACGADMETGSMPEDLNGLRQLKKEKEVTLRNLTAELEQIDEAIAKLDEKANGARRRLVTIDSVEVRTFRHFVDIQGSVQPGDAVFASGGIGGKLLRRTVDEGETVRKGQLIAVIDAENIQKQKEEIQTALELARDVYTRQKSLWDQQIGSEIQYLQAKNNVERLEKSLEALQATLRQSEVTAPISGVVDRVFVEPGESVSPGGPIVQILATQTVKVVADVPENYLGKIRKGETVTVTFPALGQEKQARVSLIGSSIDATNRTFKLEVEIPNPDQVLKPNLLAGIRFEDYVREKAVVIPIELVQQEVSGKNYVMVASTGDSLMTAQKAYVEIGKSYLGEILIENGLTRDQILIRQGARNVSEGDILDIQENRE